MTPVILAFPYDSFHCFAMFYVCTASFSSYYYCGLF